MVRAACEPVGWREVSPANSDRLWALVEATDGGVFRSENGEKNWTRINSDRKVIESDLQDIAADHAGIVGIVGEGLRVG